MEIYVGDLIGVPYKDHGRDMAGLDCYGLAIEVARRYGYELRDVYYSNHDISLSAQHAPTLNVTRIDGPKPGALIEMHLQDELHIGVCLNKREFIHMTRTGCRINRIGTLPIRGFYGIDTRLQRP